jgi:hypothetical protein
MIVLPQTSQIKGDRRSKDLSAHNFEQNTCCLEERNEKLFPHVGQIVLV